VKVWTLATAQLTFVRLVTSSTLQSLKWQLIEAEFTANILYIIQSIHNSGVNKITRICYLATQIQ